MPTASGARQHMAGAHTRGPDGNHDLAAQAIQRRVRGAQGRKATKRCQFHKRVAEVDQAAKKIQKHVRKKAKKAAAKASAEEEAQQQGAAATDNLLRCVVCGSADDSDAGS